MRDEFLRIAAASPRSLAGDVAYNVDETVKMLRRLADEKVEVVVFPELGITGYSIGDLLHNSAVTDAAEKAVRRLLELSAELDIAFAVGVPVCTATALYNCAAFIDRGSLHLVAKSYLPAYNEFYERRWFAAPCPGQKINITYAGREVTISAGTVIPCRGVNVGIEICEDLWVPIPPSCRMALEGAEVILNLSASDDLVGKYDYLKGLVERQSASCICAYAYSSAGLGESSTDLVFGAKAMITENGRMLADDRPAEGTDSLAIADIDIAALRRDRIHITTFNDCSQAEGCDIMKAQSESSAEPSDLKYRYVDPHPFVPAGRHLEDRCREILAIQSLGLARRLGFIHASSAVIGISGGLDSTLALLVTVDAFDRLKLDRRGIIGVTMPGFGTTSRTHGNAVALMERLGVTIREISIVRAVEQHFKDIGHDPAVHDVTYENSQARQRTLLLMDIANQTGGIVVGTGDLSELALGWATYNGDHMSMYGVNAGVPKTLVRHLVDFYGANCASPEVKAILDDVLATPVSPELLPATADGNIAQVTEDLVGPYELHDFFLYYLLRYGFSRERIFRLALKAFEGTEYTPAIISSWLGTFMKRFFTQQFKRSCLPDGPKVGSVNLSPRGDWRMPSDMSGVLFASPDIAGK